MKIEYVNHMGGDQLVVDAARVSFHKLASNYTIEQNEKLIKYLAEHKHWSPFAHPQVTFRVTVPIFIARQAFKHIVGSAKNEVSRRYVQSQPTFYVPETLRRPPEGSVKQGSGAPISATNTVILQTAMDIHNDNAVDFYNHLIQSGVCPEQARMVLPQSMYTEYFDTGSLAYWARVYKQRTDPHAQKEWGALMTQLDLKMTQIYPISWKELIK